MPDDKPKPDPKKQIAQQVNGARLHIVEQALVAFVEDVDGRVPSDPDIIDHGLHMQFAYTPLTTFEKDGWRFAQFFAWRRRHLVALGFLDDLHPLDLKIARVPEDAWPAVARRFVENHYRRIEGEDFREPDDPNAGEEWKKS